MKKIFFTMMLSISTLWAANIYALDFTFEVPVQLNNLHPDLTQGTVRCDVLDERPIVMGSSGAGSPGFSISGGRYEGTLTVAFNTSQAWRARSYRCELLLTRGGRAGEGMMSEAGVSATFGRDASAVFIVRGDIPAPPAR